MTGKTPFIQEIVHELRGIPRVPAGPGQGLEFR
jgi:hypothetical protein